MKKLIFTLLLLVAPVCMLAQEAEDQAGTNDLQPAPNASAPIQPSQEDQKHTKQKETEKKDNKNKPEQKDLFNYSSLFVDLGLNFLRGNLSAMEPSLWHSRVANFYLAYNIRIKQSHFTVVPGIGLGYEGYSFKENNKEYYTLVRDQDRNTKLQAASDLLYQSKNNEIIQSNLNTRYVDLLLEVRFNANRAYPKEGFSVAIGGKAGLLWSPSTRVAYQEDKQRKERIMVDTFNLNRTRYVVHAKLGWKRFSLFYAHTLSKLFDQEKGPEKTKTSPCNAGLSVDLF